MSKLRLHICTCLFPYFFITPSLLSNTTYYVREFGGTPVFGGPADNTIGGGGYYNNDRHLFLDCYIESNIIFSKITNLNLLDVRRIVYETKLEDETNKLIRNVI